MHLPAVRSTLTIALVLLATVGGGDALGAQQPGTAGGRPCNLVFEATSDRTTTVGARQATGAYHYFQGGGVRYRCAGQVTVMTADSAAYYEDRALLHLVGSVRYRDDRAELDSDRLTYYQDQEWAIAEGRVFARMENGSTLRGPNAEYLRATPARPIQRMTATARPTLLLVQPDSAGVARPPIEVIGDRLTMLGDSVAHAGGSVRITRPDAIATGDSAYLDDERGYARLMRGPRIDSRGDRSFSMTGNVIDLFSRERQLERVLSAGQARSISEDSDLRADTLDLRLVNGDLDRVHAWGPGRARATSPGRDITADSLDVQLLDQRLHEVHALGDALVEAQPDTARIRSSERDWLRGDTIVAWFELHQAPADTASRIRELLATGSAQSFQQIAPDTGVADQPSLHYVSGETITVTFEDGEPRLVRVRAQEGTLTTGVYLDASAAAAADAARTPPAAGARPSATPPPRGGTVRPPGRADPRPTPNTTRTRPVPPGGAGEPR